MISSTWYAHSGLYPISQNYSTNPPKFSTLIAVFTLDRLGRRVTLYWGCVVMGISMFLAGGFSRLSQNNANDDYLKGAYGAAGASFTFLFTFGFGATWLTVPWLYPAEIFPLQCRAKGNAWGVVGWSIGNGWTVSSLVSYRNHLRSPCTTPISLLRFHPHT